MNESKNIVYKYKIVSAHVYDPRNSLFTSNKNEKADLQTISCCNSDNCAMYKRNECCLVDSGWIGNPCHYGVQNCLIGYSRRSCKYSQWIKGQKETYADVLDKLSPESKVMAIVGEFIYLPYSHITMNSAVPFKKHGGFFNSGDAMLALKDFTIINIVSICEFKPCAMMGGEIVSYQKEEIPKFLKHLSEQFSCLYKELCERLPRIKDIPLTNVGRKAYLRTLNQNVGDYVDCHKAHWTWDGEYLTSLDSRACFTLVDEFSEIKIKPVGNPVVEIANEGQVNESTEYYRS